MRIFGEIRIASTLLALNRLMDQEKMVANKQSNYPSVTVINRMDHWNCSNVLQDAGIVNAHHQISKVELADKPRSISTDIYTNACLIGRNKSLPIISKASRLSLLLL